MRDCAVTTEDAKSRVCPGWAVLMGSCYQPNSLTAPSGGGGWGGVITRVRQACKVPGGLRLAGLKPVVGGAWQRVLEFEVLRQGADDIFFSIF